MADALSRVTYGIHVISDESDLDPSQPVFLERLKNALNKDKWVKNRENRKMTRFQNGLRWHDTCIYIPDVDDLRKEVLAHCHDHQFSGHQGQDRTYEYLRRLYWWPSLRSDVVQYVQNCHKCQINKTSSKKPAGLMQPLPIPGRLWASVSMDFITHLPMTERGFSSIFVIVDRLSKMAHFVPTKDTATATDVAQLFMHAVVRLHGPPEQLITDRDARFMGNFWQALCKLMGVSHKPSTAHHPQTDGQTERMNRMLQDYLRNYVNPLHDDWDLMLDAAEFALNNSYQASIKTTPFYMNSGQHPLTPHTYTLPQTNCPSANDVYLDYKARLERSKCFLEAAQSRQKKFYDARHREVEFNEGDDILLSTKNISLKHPGSRSLMPRYIGPFKIIKKYSPLVYRLELPKNCRLHDVFHVSLLAPYRADGNYQPPPPELTLDGEMEYEVEMILRHVEYGRGKQKNFRYYVKWRYYGPEHNTWEPQKNLTHCEEALSNYWESVRVVEHQRKLAQDQEEATQKPSRANHPRPTDQRNSDAPSSSMASPSRKRKVHAQRNTRT